MGGASLIGGLLSGFAGVGLKKQDQQHQDQMEQRRDRLAMLLNIDPMGLDEKGQQTLASLLDEAYGGGKGGSKGSGKGGQPGPFGQLFQKIGPMLAGGKKRPDGLASPVPGNLTAGGAAPAAQAQPQAQPTAQGNAAQPGSAYNMVTNPAAVLQGGGVQPQTLEAVPHPTEGPARVPQAANVPQGTMRPAEAGAGPMTLGQLYASQNRGRAQTQAAQQEIDARQAQADRFRQQWEAKNGKLTPEQENELMEWTMGMPAGFSRAGKDTVIHNVAGPEPGKAYTMIEKADGTRQYIEEMPAPKAPGAGPKPSAFQQKRDQRIQDYMAVHPNVSQAQADHAISVEDYTDEVQKRLTARFNQQLKEGEINAMSQRLVSGTPTTKDARYVLKDAIAEAKDRMRKALADAKGGWMETNGQPGPDNGKTEEQLEEEILESQGFNADELRKLAAGSAPRTPAPKGGGPARGGDPNDPYGILK